MRKKHDSRLLAGVRDRFAAVAKHFEFKGLSNVRQSKNRDSRNQTRGCVVLFDRSDAHLGDQVEPPSITQFLEALQSFKWTKDGALDGAALKAGSVKELHLAERAVTAKKLATPLDFQVGGVAIQIKGYTTAELAQIIPADREVVLNTETWILYAGDGTTTGGRPIGGTTAQEVESLKIIVTQLTQAVAKLGGETVNI